MSYPEEFSYEAGRNEEIAVAREREENSRLYEEAKKIYSSNSSLMTNELSLLDYDNNQADYLDDFIHEIEAAMDNAWCAFAKKLGV